MSHMQLTQLMGRAGRPQFDRFGVAFIMTESKDVTHCRSLTQGQEKLESCLMESLEENICSAIYHGFITDIKSAIFWLNSTFLAIRMEANPSRYIFEEEQLSPECIIFLQM